MKKRRGAPVLREFLRSAKGAFFRAAIQERNSAEPERRGAPVLREFLKSAKGAFFRADRWPPGPAKKPLDIRVQ
jgi:hypothetical protein